MLSLLPAAKCPLCLAAYAGVLSSLGLGFLFMDPLQTPIIAVLLVVGLVSVGWSSRKHGIIYPFLVALLGSIAVVTGRLAFKVPVLLHGGVALLVAAALWNLWLERPRRVQLPQIHVPNKQGEKP